MKKEAHEKGVIHHGGAGTGPKPLDNEHKGWSVADVKNSITELIS